MSAPRRSLPIAVGAFASMLFPASAAATDVEDPGVRTHDGGFLRLSVGPGWTRATADPSQTAQPRLTLTRGHMLSSGDVALGGALYEDIIIHATWAWARAKDPNLEAGDQEIDGDGERFLFSCVGLGATVYMEENLYVSGSLGLSRIAINTGDAFVGLGVEDSVPAIVVQVGKEWWVGDNLGVGAAARVLAGWNDANGSSGNRVDWRYQNVGLVLSATVN